MKVIPNLFVVSPLYVAAESGSRSKANTTWRTRNSRPYKSASWQRSRGIEGNLSRWQSPKLRERRRTTSAPPVRRGMRVVSRSHTPDVAVTLYEVLGVSSEAGAADLKKAFRKRARVEHPDVNKEPGAEARFIQLKRAYDVLSDVNKRATYDQNLRVRERVKSSRSVNIWPSAPTDTQPRKSYDDNLDIRAQQSRREEIERERMRRQEKQKKEKKSENTSAEERMQQRQRQYREATKSGGGADPHCPWRDNETPAARRLRVLEMANEHIRRRDRATAATAANISNININITLDITNDDDDTGIDGTRESSAVSPEIPNTPDKVGKVRHRFVDYVVSKFSSVANANKVAVDGSAADVRANSGSATMTASQPIQAAKSANKTARSADAAEMIEPVIEPLVKPLDSVATNKTTYNAAEVSEIEPFVKPLTYTVGRSEDVHCAWRDCEDQSTREARQAEIERERERRWQRKKEDTKQTTSKNKTN